MPYNPETTDLLEENLRLRERVIELEYDLNALKRKYELLEAEYGPDPYERQGVHE